MKLTLSNEELVEVIKQALQRFGDVSTDDIELDLGEGNTFPLALVQGVNVNLSAK